MRGRNTTSLARATPASLFLSNLPGIKRDGESVEIVTVHLSPAKDNVKTDRQLGLLMRITYADGHFFHVRGDPKEIAAAK